MTLAIVRSSPVLFDRSWCMSSPWTFGLAPVQQLLKHYVGDGIGWVDPFAGRNSPAEYTNDIDPATSAQSHLPALEFCQGLRGPFEGCLFDPPYSFRQISEHYRALGRSTSKLDTSARFYASVKDALAPRIRPGGLAISFGWHSNGFGKKRGFTLIAVRLLAHGSSKNDTIVTVERKTA